MKIHSNVDVIAEITNEIITIPISLKETQTPAQTHNINMEQTFKTQSHMQLFC